jgi:hypothetical protein
MGERCVFPLQKRENKNHATINHLVSIQPAFVCLFDGHGLLVHPQMKETGFVKNVNHFFDQIPAN